MTAADLITFPHETGVDVSTLPAAFQQTVTVRPDAVAIRTVGGIQQLTWSQYATRVEAIAGGLAALGVGRGDTVGIMLTNRPEFHLVDTAALHLGAVPFSIYNTSAPDQIEYLFGNAENRIVITEQVFLPVITAANTGVERIVVVDDVADGAISLDDVERTPPPEGFDFAASWQAVEPEDLATLIYTSGTTGPPKGVEITHRNIVAEMAALAEKLDVGFDDRSISYLPAAHIADRVSSHAANLMRGIQITTVPDPREIATALPEVHPTFFFGVPRVWQKIRAGIEAKVAEESSPVKRALAGWAFGVGASTAQARIDGKGSGLLGGVQHGIADKLVLHKVRAALGLDEVVFAGSGAAAIPVEVLKFFLGLGIPILEVWGMSETTGVSTMTTPDNLKIGTVGPPIRGMEVRLADDGELLVRGPVVMRGYRNQPEKTAETIDADGWLSTGDIAKIDDDGNVIIVDRKKELIINESGKNMSPTNIENAMKAASSLIGQVAAIGDSKPYVSALVVLDPEAVAVRAKRLSMPNADLAELSTHPEIVEEVSSAIRTGNGKLSRVEQVKRFTIVPAAWDPGGDELTPTMKLRRNPIAAKYAAEIGALYESEPGGSVVDLRS
ncbi:MULTISPECIES: AMP-dependent synthetase/ligase [Gordonia]|uniref:Acyl-CoA synthetase n=2 Tax=Gordonia alkanivorans TaxID=84096 RepID=F9W0Y2_9ACTN|nr:MULTISPECIES: long-chain fatty acid--CoA ligase [Gordonia]ETA06577.1 AMP-dependent synthetase [Gordonia alkanivorans CGMCC 6845]MDH3008039.1 long-chain fatty acid--CoA ligase [Gordonia alkanivorans]MDH3011740.1 long-chain fatty acid--CoA ligase [Gordonia alkanivorans]MDH3016902.1 long-chain fatty acid--CoA ligase [Gordonia alkanivorans]MDH3020904.1 long-chain fatty acid--CoA ligase [Gordonia alkanivorans]